MHILIDLEMSIFFPKNTDLIMSTSINTLAYHIIYLHSFIHSLFNFNIKYLKNYIIINTI